MTRVNTAVDSAPRSIAPVSVSQPAHGMGSLFVGPRGLRVGWRLLIFIGLLAVLLGGAILVGHGGPQGLREANRHMGEVTVTPFMMGASEALMFALLSLSTLVMGKIEKRKFSEYGLPWHGALKKDFWIGCLCGFLAISGTLLVMFLFHGFRLLDSLFIEQPFCIL
jgi:uncharacterized protein